MSEREKIDFSDGIIFEGSVCDVDGIGHDVAHQMTAYDFKGTLIHICPRPMCMEIIDTVHVDDLTNDEYGELMKILKSMSQYE